MLFSHFWSLVFCHISRYLTPICVSEESDRLCKATTVRAHFSVVRTSQLCQCKLFFSDCWQDCGSQMPFTWFSAMSLQLIRHAAELYCSTKRTVPSYHLTSLLGKTTQVICHCRQHKSMVPNPFYLIYPNRIGFTHSCYYYELHDMDIVTRIFMQLKCQCLGGLGPTYIHPSYYNLEWQKLKISTTDPLPSAISITLANYWFIYYF